MKIGLCTSFEQSPLLAKAGFDYVEEDVQSFLSPEEPDSVFTSRLAVSNGAELPITAACCFLPGKLKCTGPAADMEGIARYAEVAFRRAQQVGVGTIVFGSGGARQIPDGFDRAKALEQFIETVKHLAPLAERHRVTIVIEPLNSKECNFINSLAEGARVVEAVAHPQVRLLADIYHMLMDGEAAGEIITHGALLHHAHVAEREGRMAPGTSGEDFGPYLRALAKVGYRGSISFECGWKNLAEQAAASVSGFRAQMRCAGMA
jgi:sugar phosphate isomerase/epimerase